MPKPERVTYDPKVMGGQACIREMRVPVSLVLKLMANGMSHDEILRAYPYLERDDLQACLEYAAWLAEEELYPHARS